MEFITTTRGERQLLKDHYLYNKNKTGDSGNIYWDAWTEEWHGCDPTRPSSEPKINSCKKDKSQYEKAPSALFQQTLQRATEAFLAKIAKLETVCRDVRVQHESDNNNPPKNEI